MPDELALTPGGYRHPLRVHRIAPGQIVRRSKGRTCMVDPVTKEIIELPTPAEERELGLRWVPAGLRTRSGLTRPGSQSRYSQRNHGNQEAANPGAKAPMGSGWITDSIWTNTSGQPISLFTATWTVPKPPLTQSTGTLQTIFLFNGLLDLAQDVVLQPVLQWGPSHVGGGNYWAVACWFVDDSQNASFKRLIPVIPGQQLVGVMRYMGISDNLFNYDCLFQGIDGVDLTVQTDKALVVATATLESHNVQKCTDYPDTQKTAMTAIEIRTGANHAQINWRIENRVTACGQYTTVVSNASPGGEVDLNY